MYKNLGDIGFDDIVLRDNVVVVEELNSRTMTCIYSGEVVWLSDNVAVVMKNGHACILYRHDSNRDYLRISLVEPIEQKGEQNA